MQKVSNIFGYLKKRHLLIKEFMKSSLFDQQHKKDNYVCSVQLPNVFQPFLNLLHLYGLKPYFVNAGLFGTEVFTDPHWYTYIECSNYFRNEDYNTKKAQYLDYLNKKAKGIIISNEGKMQKAELKNGLNVVFCINDMNRMLLWETERPHLEHLNPEKLLLAIEKPKEKEVSENEPDLLIEKTENKDKIKHIKQRNCGMLRFDGLYILKKKENAEYLRFFPNGKVIGILFDKASEQFLKDQFDEEYEEYGTYRITEKGIIFNIAFLSGNLQVTYNGRIEENKLVLFRKIQQSMMPKQLGIYCFQQMHF